MPTDKKKFLVFPPDQHVEAYRYDNARGLYHLDILAEFPEGALQQSSSIFTDLQLRDQHFERFGLAAACQFYVQSAQALGLSVLRPVEPVAGTCYYLADHGIEHYYLQLLDKVLHVNPTGMLINELPVQYLHGLSGQHLVIQVPTEKFQAVASHVLDAMGLIQAYAPIDLNLRFN